MPKNFDTRSGEPAREQKEIRWKKDALVREIKKFDSIATATITREPRDPHFFHHVSLASGDARFENYDPGGEHYYGVHIFQNDVNADGEYSADQLRLSKEDMPESLRAREKQSTLSEEDRQWFLQHAVNSAKKKLTELEILIHESPDQFFADDDQKMLAECGQVIVELDGRVTSYITEAEQHKLETKKTSQEILEELKNKVTTLLAQIRAFAHLPRIARPDNAQRLEYDDFGLQNLQDEIQRRQQ
jgi:hypothetical protein